MKEIVTPPGKPHVAKRIYSLLLVFTSLAPALPASAQSFTTLLSFDGVDGGYPSAGLIQADDGNFYGTTSGGGNVTNQGNVFRITADGVLTVIYDFCSLADCVDGGMPHAGLVQGFDGNLYGTTQSGGTGNYGTVFSITPDGKLTTLYSFDGSHGANPYAGLIQAADGNFYGTAFRGGAYGYGTIFKITAGGKLTTLHNFDGVDGAYPYAALIQSNDGNFFGTTQSGGAGSAGTIFTITAGGHLTTLHSFVGTDGAYPDGGLVQATDGDFYGTTLDGGASGDGTVFKITASGRLTTLHNFDFADGAHPYVGLVQATDGNFYGTTLGGGTLQYGTLFKITPGGTLTTVHTFCSEFECLDGALSFGPLIQATNGDFYGTTHLGGMNSNDIGDLGVVFSVSVGLSPFIETQTTFGKVGAAVTILGTDLSGATSVTFNGSPAVFKVASSSEIPTTVPAGATTGTVEVTVPSGVLSSSKPFAVR
jgi:uncharacterized repeat protein (TIGR03803 family)